MPHSKGKMRINPATEDRFRYGDERKDGYFFSHYEKTDIKKDGFFREHWRSRAALLKQKPVQKLWSHKDYIKKMTDPTYRKMRKEKRKKYYQEDYLKWVTSEKGFFTQLFQSIRSRSLPKYLKYKPGRTLVKNHIRDKDHLLELYEKQKKLLGGPYCRYTGSTLTMKRSTGKGFTGYTKTNLSVDRIDPTLPYQEGNIVFCSWEFNQRKNSVTPDDCKRILKVYEEMNEN